MFQHCATTFEAATLELNGVATDAAGWLLHVQVQTINDASLLSLVVERQLLIGQVQLVELDWSERKWSRHLPHQSFAEINWIIKIEVTIF